MENTENKGSLYHLTKPIILCGVYNPFNKEEPVIMTQEEKENFTKMCSNNGEHNVIFVEDHSIIQAMVISDVICKSIK